MPRITEKSHQLNTIFGSGYVAEQHGDETQRQLPASDETDSTVAFGDLLKTLRSALSLR